MAFAALVTPVKFLLGLVRETGDAKHVLSPSGFVPCVAGLGTVQRGVEDGEPVGFLRLGVVDLAKVPVFWGGGWVHESCLRCTGRVVLCAGMVWVGWWRDKIHAIRTA